MQRFIGHDLRLSVPVSSAVMPINITISTTSKSLFSTCRAYTGYVDYYIEEFHVPFCAMVVSHLLSRRLACPYMQHAHTCPLMEYLITHNYDLLAPARSLKTAAIA